MPANLQVITHTFHDKPLTTLIYNGRPCWIAREVAIAIGYTEPRSFISRITGEWAAEMKEERHFTVLIGHEINELRALITDPVTSGVIIPPRTPSLLVLFEEGMHLALLKTNKPKGRDLRAVLAEHVLPQVLRDGRYLPEREVTPHGMMVESEHARRMRELDVQERELDIRIRQIKATTLVTLVDSLPYLSDDIRQAYRVKAAEEITGQNLAGLLPPAAESLSWESPTQIGKRIGVSANAVGKAITALGLRGAEGKSREIVNKATHSDRTVTSWLYSPAAVAEIEAHLRR